MIENEIYVPYRCKDCAIDFMIKDEEHDFTFASCPHCEDYENVTKGDPIKIIMGASVY